MPGSKTSWWRLLAPSLFASGVAWAQTTAPPAPVPVESFFATPDMSEPQLSPSGRYLAALVPGRDKRNMLAVIDLVEGRKGSRGLVSYNDADIIQVHWVDDEFLVYSLRDLQAGSGDQYFWPGLFSVSRQGGAPRQLVKLRERPFISEPGVGHDRRLEFNHFLLDVPHDNSREVIVGEIDFDDRGTIENVRPRRLNVQNGRISSLEHGGPARADHWWFDDTGQPRMATREADGRLKVHVRDPSTGTWSVWLDADALRPAWRPWDIDPAGVPYVVQARGSGGARALTRLDPATRMPSAEPTVVVPGYDFRGSLVTERGSGKLLGVRALTDGEITVWIDPVRKALQEDIDRRLPGRANRITCRRCEEADGALLIESWSDQDPGTYLVRRGGAQGGIERVGQRHSAIDPRRMARLSFERIRARDGRQVPVWITEPTRPPGAPPPPAVVLVHGGPWVRGGRWEWDALPQFLASRGYVVIEPEFRGSAGYGSEHFRAGWRQWGQAMQDDVTDALRWAVAEKRADGSRACIAGGSYGGYAALMGPVRDPDLYRCAAAWAAVSEPLRLLERSWWWSDDISDEARRYSLPQMIGDVKTDAAMLEAASPLRQAARIKVPVLLVHGERDRRVPIVHAKEMREALRKNGQEPEWLVFDDEAHGWLKPENQHAFARKLESFLAKHLK